MTPTREQATIYYVSLTTPALQRWLNSFQKHTSYHPGRSWHVSEIKRILKERKDVSYNNSSVVSV